MCIDERERGFIAGFLEGDASLSVREQNGGQSYSCEMALKQRDDSQATMERLLTATGIGRLYRVPARTSSKPQIAWLVNTQEHCRSLLALVDSGFHGRRAAELRLWSQAVYAWTEASGESRRRAMRSRMLQLATARRFGGGAPAASPFGGRRDFLGYISGFLSAEGCFGLWDARPRFSVHVRQDDKPLLELLASSTGLGEVSEHRPGPPLNPSATWTIASRADLAAFICLLRQGCLSERKLRELEIWGDAVAELKRSRPRREVLEHARDRLAAGRVYKPSKLVELPKLPSRDLRKDCLDALAAWSRETPGKLPCTDYMRWRRDQPNAPTRNTIVSQLGSWQDALEAAGVAHRLARPPRRAGGEVTRAAERARQRARVIEAVRLYEREHSRLPRALEFFRWRLERAIDAPTQATVYKLFPGGWAEVLRVLSRSQV